MLSRKTSSKKTIVFPTVAINLKVGDHVSNVQTAVQEKPQKNQLHGRSVGAMQDVSKKQMVGHAHCCYATAASFPARSPASIET